ncbi:MAG: dual specificity protein phosphatase, partial [bacterium]
VMHRGGRGDGAADSRPVASGGRGAYTPAATDSRRVARAGMDERVRGGGRSGAAAPRAGGRGYAPDAADDDDVMHAADSRPVAYGGRRAYTPAAADSRSVARDGNGFDRPLARPVISGGARGATRDKDENLRLFMDILTRSGLNLEQEIVGVMLPPLGGGDQERAYHILDRYLQEGSTCFDEAETQLLNDYLGSIGTDVDSLFVAREQIMAAKASPLEQAASSSSRGASRWGDDRYGGGAAPMRAAALRPVAYGGRRAYTPAAADSRRVARTGMDVRGTTPMRVGDTVSFMKTTGRGDQQMQGTVKRIYNQQFTEAPGDTTKFVEVEYVIDGGETKTYSAPITDFTVVTPDEVGGAAQVVDGGGYAPAAADSRRVAYGGGGGYAPAAADSMPVAMAGMDVGGTAPMGVGDRVSFMKTTGSGDQQMQGTVKRIYDQPFTDDPGDTTQFVEVEYVTDEGLTKKSSGPITDFTLVAPGEVGVASPVVDGGGYEPAAADSRRVAYGGRGAYAPAAAAADVMRAGGAAHVRAAADAAAAVPMGGGAAVAGEITPGKYVTFLLDGEMIMAQVVDDNEALGIDGQADASQTVQVRYKDQEGVKVSSISIEQLTLANMPLITSTTPFDEGLIRSEIESAVPNFEEEGSHITDEHLLEWLRTHPEQVNNPTCYVNGDLEKKVPYFSGIRLQYMSNLQALGQVGAVQQGQRIDEVFPGIFLGGMYGYIQGPRHFRNRSTPDPVTEVQSEEFVTALQQAGVVNENYKILEPLTRDKFERIISRTSIADPGVVRKIWRGIQRDEFDKPVMVRGYSGAERELDVCQEGFGLVVDAIGESEIHEEYPNQPGVTAARHYPYKEYVDVGRSVSLKTFRGTYYPQVTEESLVPDYLNPILQRIDEAYKRGEKVFVHCQQGKDRSASVIACYIAKKMGVSIEQALTYIQQRRDFAKPKEGMLALLKQNEPLYSLESS